MNREDLRAKLGKFVGGATLSAESISSISDMNELIKLWGKYSTPGDKGTIEARMTAVIKALPVCDIERLPEWFLSIVEDETALPTKQLRIVFKEKAKAIYAQL